MRAIHALLLVAAAITKSEALLRSPISLETVLPATGTQTERHLGDRKLLQTTNILEDSEENELYLEGLDGEHESDSGEERAGGVPGLSSVKDALSKASAAMAKTKGLPNEKKVQRWIAKEKPITDVQKVFGVENLAGVALKSAQNFPLYDDYMGKQVAFWLSKGRSVRDVKSRLGLDKLDDAAFTSHPNFKYYNMFVVNQLPSWKNLSPSEVKAILGIDKLSDAALASSPNFKYYKVFLTAQVRRWDDSGLSPSDVLAKLELAGLSGKALTSNPNYKYYDKFVSKQVPVWSSKELPWKDVAGLLRLDESMWAGAGGHFNYKYYDEFMKTQISKWLTRDLSANDVKVRLGLHWYEGDAFLDSLNYKFYDKFVTGKLEQWAVTGLSADKVKVNLGLEKLSGHALRSNENYKWLDLYQTSQQKYLLDGLLKQSTTTFDAWQKLGLDKFRPSLVKYADNYKVYSAYAQKVDEFIARNPARAWMFQDAGSAAEMKVRAQLWADAGRSKSFVKSVLGLSNLADDAFRAHPSYAYYKQFLASRSVRFVAQ